MVKAKGRKRPSKTQSKYKDKVVIALFAGLLLIGVVAIVIASFSSSTNTPTSTTPPALELLAQPTDELQVIDVKKGEGDPVANGNTLRVHYTGYLEDGTVFDSSLYRNETYSFKLGSGQVIKGWDQGLVGMQPGGVRQLIIPPSLGYGENDHNKIPGGSTLIFNIELVSVS